jgi:hypothetical protein
MINWEDVEKIIMFVCSDRKPKKILDQDSQLLG